MGEGISIAPPTCPRARPAARSGSGRWELRSPRGWPRRTGASSPCARTSRSTRFLPTRIPLAASRAFTFGWPLPRNGLAFSTVRGSPAGAPRRSAPSSGPATPHPDTLVRELVSLGPVDRVDAAHWPSPCCRRSDKSAARPVAVASIEKKRPTDEDRADRSTTGGDSAPLRI